MEITSKIDYKLMLKFSPVIGLLLCVILWTAAIGRTWESYKAYAKSMKNENQSEKLSISPAYTQSRVIAINKLYHKYEVDTLKWKGRLWNHCANLARKHSVSMRSFSAWEHIAINEDLVLIQKVEMSGNYHNLISLQQELERLPEIGKITGIVYQKPLRETQVILNIILTGIPLKR